MGEERNNHRVTNAILSTKLDTVIRELAEVKGLVSRIDDRVDEVEKEQARSWERWKAHRADHERERNALMVVSTVVSTVESAVAGLIGVLVHRP